jgi:hypothetical protein
MASSSGSVDGAHENTGVVVVAPMLSDGFCSVGTLGGSLRSDTRKQAVL